MLRSRREDGTVGKRATENIVVPAHFFNGRLIIVLSLLFLIGFLLISPVTNFFSQRAEIVRQEEALQQVRNDNKGLMQLRELQGDEEYVKQQARQRLRMAVPGETPYIVVGKAPDQRSETGVGNGDLTGEKVSWKQKIMDSMEQSVQFQQKAAKTKGQEQELVQEDDNLSGN